MIGLAIGLLCTLAITQILVVSEGQKRDAMAGSDAQVSGLLALAALRQSIQTAGYGFSSSPDSVGCNLKARFNGLAVPGFPATLVPVLITDGDAGAPDTIRVLSSTKTSFSVPIRVVAPNYNPSVVGLSQAFPVQSVRGVAAGDLMLAMPAVSAPVAPTDCELFRVSSDPGALAQVDRVDDNAHWNPAGFPTQTYGDAGIPFLINLGGFGDTTFSISALGALQSNKFVMGADSTPSFTGATDLFDNIVNLQALYGKDTLHAPAQQADTWDTTTPTSNASWLQVMAVRIAVVSRSNQYEKEEVTFSNPLWDVGTEASIPGAVACGASKCVALKVDQLSDWKHYRYKVYDTIVPLRNILWTS
jgi:type IV pilus assembly protein PilW